MNIFDKLKFKIFMWALINSKLNKWQLKHLRKLKEKYDIEKLRKRIEH